MSCNCLKELNDKLKEKFQHDNPEIKIKESYFENCAFIQRGKKDGKINMPLELTAAHMIKYTILSRKGNELNRKNGVNVCFTYCPFCGKKLEEGEQL